MAHSAGPHRVVAHTLDDDGIFPNNPRLPLLFYPAIIDLPEDAPVGMSYAQYAGLDDPVIEIGLTPNRPDCTGVFGIARDLRYPRAGLLGIATPEAFERPLEIQTSPADLLTFSLGLAVRF